MLLEHERYYGLGMDAAVIACSSNTNGIMFWPWMLLCVCTWNTNVIMVWAWILWRAHALGTRTLLWFGHGCCGDRMLLEHERNYGLGMDALVRMHLEHERNYGLGMDSLVSVCTWNTNGIMVWAWILW